MEAIPEFRCDKKVFALNNTLIEGALDTLTGFFLIAVI
jgi:hypothetical protein